MGNLLPQEIPDRLCKHVPKTENKYSEPVRSPQIHPITASDSSSRADTHTPNKDKERASVRAGETATLVGFGNVSEAFRERDGGGLSTDRFVSPQYDPPWAVKIPAPVFERVPAEVWVPSPWYWNNWEPTVEDLNGQETKQAWMDHVSSRAVVEESSSSSSSSKDGDDEAGGDSQTSAASPSQPAAAEQSSPTPVPKLFLFPSSVPIETLTTTLHTKIASLLSYHSTMYADTPDAETAVKYCRESIQTLITEYEKSVSGTYWSGTGSRIYSTLQFRRFVEMAKVQDLNEKMGKSFSTGTATIRPVATPVPIQTATPPQTITTKSFQHRYTCFTKDLETAAWLRGNMLREQAYDNISIPSDHWKPTKPAPYLLSEHAIQDALADRKRQVTGMRPFRVSVSLDEELQGLDLDPSDRRLVERWKGGALWRDDRGGGGEDSDNDSEATVTPASAGREKEENSDANSDVTITPTNVNNTNTTTDKRNLPYSSSEITLMDFIVGHLHPYYQKESDREIVKRIVLPPDFEERKGKRSERGRLQEEIWGKIRIARRAGEKEIEREDGDESSGGEEDEDEEEDDGEDGDDKGHGEDGDAGDGANEKSGSNERGNSSNPYNQDNKPIDSNSNNSNGNNPQGSKSKEQEYKDENESNPSPFPGCNAHKYCTIITSFTQIINLHCQLPSDLNKVAHSFSSSSPLPNSDLEKEETETKVQDSETEADEDKNAESTSTLPPNPFEQTLIAHVAGLLSPHFHGHAHRERIARLLIPQDWEEKLWRDTEEGEGAPKQESLEELGVEIMQAVGRMKQILGSGSGGETGAEKGDNGVDRAEWVRLCFTLFGLLY
ncbi:hypothetical protein EJ02DRAFT_437573 [Clathrospora elynae]|uniref:Uncharacterized protein n=1 Tax=Clathrospora elynae TaxID=706981 RepID=A0A6A5SEF9_9PLEO|nr:hypothetical protein EJ02DRAFT_437573 [Clathrospora elynae]